MGVSQAQVADPCAGQTRQFSPAVWLTKREQIFFLVVFCPQNLISIECEMQLLKCCANTSRCATLRPGSVLEFRGLEPLAAQNP